MYIPRVSKTLKKVGPVQTTSFLCFWVFLNTYFVLCWFFTFLFLWGRPLSNFYFNTYSNFILTVSEISQTEHTIETEANVIKQYACILHRPQLPPKLRTVPSEVVKESLCLCTAFQKSAFQMWTQQTDISSDNLHCLLLSGSGNCRFNLAKRQAEPKISAS